MRTGGLMIVGLGDLGGHVLEFLARVPNMPRIVTADINEEWGYRKTNSAIVGAAQFGHYPNIEYVPMDAFDVDRTAETLKKYAPDVIYNSMTLQSWWVITQLSKDQFNTIDEGRYGPWYPMHFVPAHKLMQAVKKSGITTHVVNAAFPDLVNATLAKIGLAPTVGIGNIDCAVQSLKLVALKMFAVPLQAITIYMVAPHVVSYYLVRYGTAEQMPYHLKVMIDDKDVTPQINHKEFFANVLTTGRRAGGVQSHPVVASSACHTLMGILFDQHVFGHAPGPNGLPGGYPVKLSAEGAEVCLPDGVSLERAVEINNAAQVFEGVEQIQEDGTVIITDKSAGVFKRVLGYDCKKYTVAESEYKAKELGEKFRKWATGSSK